MLAFFMKSWGKWLIVGAIIAGLVWAVDHYRGQAALSQTKLETVTTENKRMIEERKVLVDNQAKWEEFGRRIDELSRQSAEARAAENAKLTNIAADVAAAKEGIKNAPGADDRFVFSDPAYGIMRPRPDAGSGAGNNPAP